MVSKIYYVYFFLATECSKGYEICKCNLHYFSWF